MVEKQKTILITGCSSGIGFCAAKRLQALGYRVVASVRQEEDIARLLASGLEHVVRLDLACSKSIYAAVEQTLEIGGGELFALFNNGAYGLPGAVEDLPREALRRQFEVNVFGTHELTTLLIPSMLQQRDARIVQNSSVLGLAAMVSRGAYISSKFALEGLTDTLRLELRETPIKVVLIEPGPIASDFRKNALKAMQRDINYADSRHQQLYRDALERLNKPGPASSFTLPADAVVDKLIKALEAKNPKPRYYVTFPTYLLGGLRRVLSTRMMDWFMSRVKRF